MFCRYCGSSNVFVQIVSDYKMKKKHRSVFYWLFIGWWLHPLLWILLFIPMLIIKLFVPKRQQMVSNQYRVAVCQNCGGQWQI